MHSTTTKGRSGGRSLRRSVLGSMAALLAIASILLVFLTPAAQASPRPHQVSATGGSFVSVTPTRIADTRFGSGMPYAGRLLSAGGTLNVQVTGVGGIPATGVCAAVLNVTDAGSTAPGFLTVFPTGATQPLASNLNFVANQIVPNQATVPVGTGGMVSIFNHTGVTNVVVDVDGYYTCSTSSTSTGLYNAVSPTRALGSLASGAAIAANTSQAVTVTGAATGVPANASAVVVNITAAGGTSASFLAAYPAGGTLPTVSNLNFGVNETVANRTTVGIGTNGQIDVYNHTGTVNVDVDVDGYYTGTAGAPGSAFFPITPVRLTDTRSSMNGTLIAANATEAFALTNSAIATNATAVQTNVTVVAGNASGFLTVYPTSDSTPPVASDVNWTANGIVPNATIAGVDTSGKVDMYNGPAVGGAPINVVIDASGYFAPTGLLTASSATATNTAIAVTYNQPVSCPATGADSDFTYNWTGSASGGTITGCTTSGDVLTLTATGGFTLPSSSATLTYTAPAAPTTTNAVYPTGSTSVFAATQTIPVAGAPAPTMVSAVTTPTTVAITYNESVTCSGATVPAAFAYDWTGSAPGITGTVTAACSGDVLTLTTTGSVTAPSSSASITYTAPATDSVTASVYATGSVPPIYAATQTLTTFTAPSITAATVTTAAITLIYNENVTCPTAASSDFAYFSTGSTTGGAVTACTSATDQVTLAGTFTLPAGTTGSVVYTAPSAPSTLNSVYSATSPQFPATQTEPVTATAAPAMMSAVVTAGTSIAITYSEPVSCSATGADTAFTYDYTFGTPGGAATGCSTSGDVLTLTGAFNANLGSATIAYTSPGTPSTSNAVYATGSTSDFAATQTISGSAIS